MKVEILNKSPHPNPEYAHKVGDSGVDIRAWITEEESDYIKFENNYVIVKPKTVRAISTGLYVAIPIGLELQLRPRSGLSIKSYVNLSNCIGTIDSNYRQEIKILIYNFGDNDFIICDGDRIVQAILTPVFTIEWVDVTELPDSSRSSGLGHTGVK